MVSAIDFLAVSNYVNECPNCGSGILGTGHGSYQVDDSIVERMCECGFYFRYNVADGVQPKLIKQAIDFALSEV